MQLKAELFGNRSDKEQKEALVSPTYENPGYVDVEDLDDVSTCVLCFIGCN